MIYLIVNMVTVSRQILAILIHHFYKISYDFRVLVC